MDTLNKKLIVIFYIKLNLIFDGVNKIGHRIFLNLLLSYVDYTYIHAFQDTEKNKLKKIVEINYCGLFFW
jgi:hypothetical protein